MTAASRPAAGMVTAASRPAAGMVTAASRPAAGMVAAASRLAAGLVAAAVAALSACSAAGAPASGHGAGGDRTRQLTVFAAASLTDTFTALGERFEADHPGVRVRFNFAGSSALAQQIAAGAPADVFASAGPAPMATVSTAGEVAGAARVFARNRLEIAVPAGNPLRIGGLADLARPGVTVALCAPQVPCGDAARRALAAAGVTVTPATLETDVRAALTKVRLGEVDAALVYATDVPTAGDVAGVAFDEAAAALNDYSIAALAGTPRPGLAADFVAAVTGPAGRAVLAGAGFTLP